MQHSRLVTTSRDGWVALHDIEKRLISSDHQGSILQRDWCAVQLFSSNQVALVVRRGVPDDGEKAGRAGCRGVCVCVCVLPLRSTWWVVLGD